MDCPRSSSSGAAALTGPVIPGGGTGHPGAADAVARFFAAAERLAADGVRTLFVGPAGGAAAANLQVLGSVPQAELAALLRGASRVVVNGGSTLLQAIAGGAACLAVPIARDQIGRIRRCVRAGVAIGAGPDAAGIVEKACSLLNDEQARAALAQRAGGLRLADGIEVAVGALDKLLEST